MGLLYEQVIRRGLFRLDPERAHELAVHGLTVLAKLPPICRLLEWQSRLPGYCQRPIRLMGISFPNAIGLAAGFDKNATGWPALAALGFGHVEVGTITALAQPGNEQPRVFRFPREAAVINRMGFNNDGAEAVARRLARQPAVGGRRIPLGINLGKSKVTELDRATEDYLASFRLLADYADYVALNVSSPNTPGLRKLQDEGRLRELLTSVAAANRARSRPVPLLLKIAPDLTFAQIDAVLAALFDARFDGLIATNTTLARPGPFGAVEQAGGLSGRPLRGRSTEIIRYVARATGGRLPIIGVGGIEDGASAAEKLDAGASLLQIYTGMIFRGPWLAAELARAVAERQHRY